MFWIKFSNSSLPIIAQNTHTLITLLLGIFLSSTVLFISTKKKKNILIKTIESLNKITKLSLFRKPVTLMTQTNEEISEESTSDQEIQNFGESIFYPRSFFQVSWNGTE